MFEPIISVSGLSKRYVIGHQVRHDTLRDAMVHGLQRLARLGRHPARSQDSGEFWALRDVSFEVRRGEVVGIIGRNGAGKSTLLKVLSRITEPTRGRIALRGRVASLLEVGTGFHPELSGRENIFLNGAILGMSREEIRRKFDEIVAFAEVEQFLDTPVKRYSSGMYVRLAFAVAAHLEPEIHMVDEVLAVGDHAFQRKCLGKMEQVAGGGRTVLFVSHNMAAIQQLCSRALYLEHGRLAGIGEPQTEIRHYLGTATAGSGRVRDLAALARGGDLRGGARILTAELAPAAGLAPWTLAFRAPLRLTFAVEVKNDLPTCELGIGVFNLQGQEILSTLSSWQGDLGPLAPGRYAFTVDFGVLDLTPGNYRCGVGLKSNRDLEDYLPEACEFEVVAASGDGRPAPLGIHGAIAHRAQYSVARL